MCTSAMKFIPNLHGLDRSSIDFSSALTPFQHVVTFSKHTKDHNYATALTGDSLMSVYPMCHLGLEFWQTINPCCFHGVEEPRPAW